MISTEIKNILATSASICTILQFLAGVLVCRKYIKNGTTGDSSSLAFITCYMSCSLWLRYGLLIGDSFIVLVNIFGTILQVCYVLIFMLYSVKKSVTLRQFAAATCFLAIVYFYVAYETNKEIAAKYIGLISCSVTILFFASPLVMLAHVLRIKNTESLPFPIILASLIVSCQWFVYGYLINDQFIQMPNFMGCILSAFQLSLFCLYPNKRVDQIPLV
ncbi:sugar transporter SWEET1-like [Vespa mandarinia]|uniref:sugar transporter SWEET1-like n=1 Tax=Vespa mandarinia TaxID=7446 RepID=UPI001619C482|nr:sugar transporter SWEET1-like [Vespa mandarinia]